MRTAAAAAICVIALAAASVQAMQWSRAYTDDGSLFYPGVTVTIKFWRASDCKVNTVGVKDGGAVQVTVNQYAFNPQDPGLESDYCDGCVLAPGTGQGNDITVTRNGQDIRPFAGTNNLAPNQYLTLMVAGTFANQYNESTIRPDANRWYRANFWTGTQAGPLSGSFKAKTVPWMLGQDGDTDVDLTVEIPGSNALRTYQAYSQVWMNVTVADTPDGDDSDAMGFNNNGANVAQPTFSTPYFVLAPFLYGLKVVNNQNMFSQGSQIQFTGAALDTGASYQCIFNNTRTNTIAYSSVTNPTSSTQFMCTFPDALADVTSNGDVIQLTNITCTGVTSGKQNWGYLPVTSVRGTMPKWTYVFPLPPVPPGPDGGGTGLTGGQIFGIILAVFVGVGLLAYGGFYFYKKRVAGDAGFYSQQTDTVDSKPQQIQYNPSSYGSQAIDSSKAGGFQADNI